MSLHQSPSVTRSASLDLSSFWGSLLALIAGAVYPLAFAPLNWWPVAPLAVAAFYLCMQHSQTARQAMWRGWLFGFGLFGVGTSWVWISMHRYGDTSVALATLLTVLFCAALALFFVIQAALHHRIARNQLWAYLGFPAVWVVGELIRTYLLTGFPWLLLGYSSLDTLWQGWSPVLGVYGLSALFALASVGLAKLIQPEGNDRRLPAILVIVIPALLGLLLFTLQWTHPTTQAPLKVMLVQGNVEQNAKWHPDSAMPTIERYETMTQKAWSGPALVVWPETAIPALLNDAYSVMTPFADDLYQRQSALISGVMTRVEKEGTRSYHNSLVVLGDGLGLYHKRHLVPFGEYVPLESVLRGLIAFFDLPMSQFSKGDQNQPELTAMGHKISASICYEVAYPDLMRRSVGDADMLLTVSNDTWFGGSFARYQHLQMVQMRALEVGRPMVRATNDGMTAVIDHQGRITQQLEPFRAGVLTEEVQGYEGQTPYMRWGDWPLIILSVLLTLAGMLVRRRQA